MSDPPKIETRYELIYQLLIRISFAGILVLVLVGAYDYLVMREMSIRTVIEHLLSSCLPQPNAPPR